MQNHLQNETVIGEIALLNEYKNYKLPKYMSIKNVRKLKEKMLFLTIKTEVCLT